MLHFILCLHFYKADVICRIIENDVDDLEMEKLSSLIESKRLEAASLAKKENQFFFNLQMR